MSSIISGYNYDIFISYRQKDNKHDGWVTEFVENLKGELESTFKEEISVYFDINPHDGLLETHDVNASLKDKLKCLIFIPIISRTYCDPKSFAWEHEFKAFIEQASNDQFGLKVKLPNGNVASRVLPIQIHDLYPEDKAIIEKELGGVLRALEFIYKEPGVNRPLTPKDSEEKNSNKTNHRNQINKVANAIDEIIHCLKGKEPAAAEKRLSAEKPTHGIEEDKSNESSTTVTATKKSNKWLIIAFSLLLCIVGMFAIYKVVSSRKQAESFSNRDKSIAVLPFVDDSPDKDNEYFCNGMMEEILNQLQKIGALKVKARTSSERYRNPNKDIKVIGKELGVSLIMEGSVRKIGDDLRIAAQLIDAKTGDHLWSEIYDGKYTAELFEFQSNIAKKVAASLNAVITPQEAKKIEAKSTTDMVAYDLLMRGHEMVRKFRYTQDSTLLKLALNLFDQALKIDPIYTDALGGKGLTYTESGKYDSALYYFKKILEIDPHDFQSAQGIGYVYMNSNNYDSAFKYYQKANELKPNDIWINLALGTLLYTKNEVLKSLPYYNKAIEFEGDLLAEINENVASPFFLIGDYTTALKYYHNALFLRSECRIIKQYVHCYLNQKEYNKAFELLDSIGRVTTCSQVCDIIRSRVYIYLKDYVKAEEFYKKAINSGYKQTKDDEIYLGCILIETGRKKEAISVLRKTIESDEDTSAMVPSRGFWEKLIKYRLVAAYAMIGDYKKALGYLSELEKLGFFEYPVVLNTFPGFDNLRNDPEFKAIVKRMEDGKASLREQVKQMKLRGVIDL
jgi:TolB-like protein/Tfp pilus assembly protein PilF